MHRRQWIAFTVAAAAAGSVFAQGYPTKVVKLVVPFAPGGTTDIVARVTAERVGVPFGQTMVVENKSGVLTRVTSLFARRGFNIDSLVVSEGRNLH